MIERTLDVLVHLGILGKIYAGLRSTTPGSIPILNVLGLTRSARAGLELTTSRMLSESNTTRLLDHFVTLKGDLEVGHSPVFSVLNKVLLQGNIIFRVNKAIVTVLRHSVT
jgi:hypothetical protein